MWGHVAWQVHTRQKMGYDFARIRARQLFIQQVNNSLRNTLLEILGTSVIKTAPTDTALEISPKDKITAERSAEKAGNFLKSFFWVQEALLIASRNGRMTATCLPFWQQNRDVLNSQIFYCCHGNGKIEGKQSKVSCYHRIQVEHTAFGLCVPFLHQGGQESESAGKVCP